MLAALLTLALSACDQGRREEPRQPTEDDEEAAAEGTSESAPVDGDIDRTSLPVLPPDYEPVTELDARNVEAPPLFEVRAPEGAPNVLVVLIDDIGFGAAQTFGGAIRTPTLERLAENGLRYNQFHTTALCSPTRMALLTGRNHHSANTGSVQEVATAFPGNQGMRPRDVAPLAEMLRLNGYSTAAFGKYHETPPWETSIAGPYDRWPTQSGFERFYGFIAGETNQWAPMLTDGTTPVEPPDDPDYHVTTDLTDHAIAWMRGQHSMAPDKPFFLYFATGAVHAPHHVPQEFVERYRGQFDEGWDTYREATLARQIELGVVPEGTELTPRPDELPAWDSLSDDERRLFARQMEVFAGFMEHTDVEVGRIVDALEALDQLDNTLVFYIFGDNGASGEGGVNGTWNEIIALNGLPTSVEEQLEHIDELGGPNTYPHFSAAWAHASNTPFQWVKQVASHYGGTRNPLVVHWPEGIEATGEVRSQWHHVNDVAATVMAAAGLPFPETVHGVEQRPFEGVSMAYSFDDADAEDQHTTQYFEMFGNRAIYHEGWVAALKHKTPWNSDPDTPLGEGTWALYHVAEDFSQAHDLAAEEPERLAELQALFLEEAARYNVLPLDDRVYERFNAALAGRPDVMGDRTSLTVYEGMPGMTQNAFINTMNRTHTITAQIEVAEGTEGVIISQGGRFAGWSLYMVGGQLRYHYNYMGQARYTVSAPEPLPPGEHVVRLEFRYDGGDPGSGATAVLFVDDAQVGEERLERTMRYLISADELANVGRDSESPVTEDYAEGDNEFTGSIAQVTITIEP
ncbi:MAG: arylsulfatase [Sandaracinaceae bacterium]